MKSDMYLVGHLAVLKIFAMTVLASVVAGYASDVQAAEQGATQLSSSQSAGLQHNRDCSTSQDVIDRAALQDLIGKLEAGKFGNVDEFLLYSGECLTKKVVIGHNYQKIYDGSESPASAFDYRSATIHPYYRGTSLHTVQSITKSVTAIVYAIALYRGDLKGEDAAIIEYFDNAEIKNPDVRKKAIQIRHLMNMTSGLDWRDDPDSPDLEQKTADWARFVIDKPMASEPGSHFLYSNGDGALLAHVFFKATGIDIAEYAERHLFKPLGIKEYHWKRAPNGLVDTTGGLYLRGEDLAKFGMLVLDRGKLGGRQMYAPDFIDPNFTIPTGRDAAMGGYNNLFWVPISPCSAEFVLAGNGYGGQRLLIFPKHRVVAVFLSWNLAEFYDALSAKSAFSETFRLFKQGGSTPAHPAR